MPATHTCLHFHLVFSTKNRSQLLTDEWRANMHAYLGGIIRNMKGVPVAINGTADHVHLLAGLRATHCLSDVLRDLKSSSSDWATATAGKKFAWQPGYFGVTVSPSQLKRVKEYIARQEEHHRHRTLSGGIP